ncbi:hypothetical protein GTR04_4392 [Trichophyton interdigitale]|uniref:Uncharacterized protein n=1 Tax=Trichophyton interdigitale TaxID=101480 RepID=A0A9P4YHW2_9EURO|nr:hypothetical protein GY632_4024 [Trichophyton interdigitale]KAG5204581.1 hypothetical protein GY631_7061 [Trichophyton interdigitale]KAG8208210.1 hypothetical protein GTR04_4392 [Trichophyton interdigitale]
MKKIPFLLALMGPSTAVGYPWHYHDGRIVVREIVSEIFGSSAPAPPPPYNNINTSLTPAEAPPSPSSWPPNIESCHCPITYVPMLPVECTGELFYATKPPRTVYTTITEMHTMKNIDTAPIGPPTLVTPPPPCSTYSCHPTRCKMGFFPPLAPLISTVSVTKKTTIMGIPSAEPPPSFQDTGSGSAASQNIPPTASPTDDSSASRPSGKSKSDPGPPDEPHSSSRGTTTSSSPGNSPEGRPENNQGRPQSGTPNGQQGGSPGNSRASPQTTLSQPPGRSMPVDPGHITSEGAGPSHSVPTRTMFNLGGIPITIQETDSITIGNGPSRTTITSNTTPTTFSVDGHTFTVNPSEVIYLDTTFHLGADPMKSPPLVSGTANPTDRGDSGGPRTDDEGHTISPRPTGTKDGSPPNQNLAVRISTGIKTTLILGVSTALIFGGIVGFL